MRLQVDTVRFRTLETTKDPYVKLVAESNEVFEKKKVVYILLSTRRGYIFIQTDKTIYNPGQQGKKIRALYGNRNLEQQHCIDHSCMFFFLVNYRLFTLDNYLLPVSEAVNVQIIVSIHLCVFTYTMGYKN